MLNQDTFDGSSMQHFRRIFTSLVLVSAALAQQQPAPTIPRSPLGPGPFTFDTAEQRKIRIVILTKGWSHPWGLAFLPDGNMLVTEPDGRLRLLRDFILDPKPISGVPEGSKYSNTLRIRNLR